MPFEVSQWPYSPDPRLPEFNQRGWDFGQVPPWQWSIQTVGALPPFEGLNQPVRIKPTVSTPAFTQFRSYDSLQDGLVVDMVISGWEEIQTNPQDHTIEIFLSCGTEFHEALQATNLLLFPTAIATKGPFVLLDFGSPQTIVPNGVSVTPRRWDA